MSSELCEACAVCFFYETPMTRWSTSDTPGIRGITRLNKTVTGPGTA